MPTSISSPVAQPPAPKPIAIDTVLGGLDLRTPAEETEFQECESLVRQGCANFAQVGEALARIRDRKLYRNEYASFELYCRERWGFGRSQGSRYIAAAQLRQTLGTIPDVPMPECEAQVRPLIGLPEELAQEAWLHALSWSREGYVPARLVKRAVKRLLRDEQPVAALEANRDRQQRHRLRESVRTGFQELLTLLLGSAERDALIAKVQEIQRLLEPLLGPRKTKV